MSFFVVCSSCSHEYLSKVLELVQLDTKTNMVYANRPTAMHVVHALRRYRALTCTVHVGLSKLKFSSSWGLSMAGLVVVS